MFTNNTIEEPMIMVENRQGKFLTTIQNSMFERREVEFIGEVSRESMYSLIRQIMYLDRKEPGKLITMYINSYGGMVTEGLALLDVMKSIKSPIKTVCIGTAASMGAVIFVSGSEREMLPHATVMIHDPLVNSLQGSAMYIKQASEELMKTRDTLAEIISEHSKMSKEEVIEKTEKTTTFTAEEAIEVGICDRVVLRL